jgi:hypothetical protein
MAHAGGPGNSPALRALPVPAGEHLTARVPYHREAVGGGMPRVSTWPAHEEGSGQIRAKTAANGSMAGHKRRGHEAPSSGCSQ